MTTQTTTLADFLLARYDEHEDSVMDGDWPFPGSGDDGFDARAWLLRDIEAKRRIVERWQRLHEMHPENGTPQNGALAHLTFVLRDLASVYADHPEFQEAWHV